MATSYLIKNGLVVDPAQKIEAHLDVKVENGLISAVGENLSGADEVIDAQGKIVLPGVIDSHVHLREPGQEHKETYYTGTRAAAQGGIVAVVPMANTSPPVQNRADLKLAASLAEHDAWVKVFPTAAATVRQEGVELTEYATLKENGAVALSDDGAPISNAAVMRRVLEYSKMFDLPILSHCEDLNLTANGDINEGLTSTILGLGGMNRAAEDIMIARDILLSEITGGRLHIQHVSTYGAVELIRQAKVRGAQVTAEATPHHFTLTDEVCKTFDTRTKMNPPLRTEADRQALIKGLADGTIDTIATDHAPHTYHEKTQEFSIAPFGIIGLETMIPLIMSELVTPGHLSLSQAVAKITINPARILRLDIGTLQTGKPAHITMVDPNLEYTYSKEDVISKSKNSPFFGRTMRGWPVLTMVSGTIVMRDRQLYAPPSHLR